MEQVQINIDVTDWAETALQAEEVPQTDEELVRLAVDRNWGAKQTAQIALAMRAMGHVPAEILPPDKAVLAEGGAYFVHHVVAAQKTRFERNGKEQEMRSYTAVQQGDDDDDGDESEQASFETDAEATLPERGYVEAGTPESVENAIAYLHRRVPGHIRNRLVEIWAGGGDVREVAEDLIALIRGMVDELVE